MTRLAAALLVVLLPLAACSSTAPAEVPPSAAGPSAPSADPGTPAPSGSASPVLQLRGDGLALVAGGRTTRLPFGTGTSIVVPALAEAFGSEPGQQSVECGQGARADLGVDGFDVLFDGQRFVGWDESGGNGRAALSTAEGLTLGSTRAQVAAALPDATFTKATLGPEFSSPGGLGGFLDGETAAARVVGLTGGETCVAR